MAGTGNFGYKIQTRFMARAEYFELHLTQPDEMVYDLLVENGLPTADLETGDLQLFKAIVGGEVVGIGGFEQYGTDALLRSVVVHPDLRGRGYGTRICLELEDKMCESLCMAIYLLTDDTSNFFEQLGYEQVDRNSAPDAIQGTREFSELCPSTFVCMVKTI